MNKQLDSAIIQNELRSGSVFFAQPSQVQEQSARSASSSLPEPTKSKQNYRTKDLSSDRSKVNRREVTTKQKTERPNGNPFGNPNERTEIRTVQKPTKRLTRRYSFEFFDDQINKLRRLKYKAEIRGERLTLSDMARQALDNYLETRFSQTERKSVRKSERTNGKPNGFSLN